VAAAAAAAASTANQAEKRQHPYGCEKTKLKLYDIGNVEACLLYVIVNSTVVLLGW
jgi:hypothetical protein